MGEIDEIFMQHIQNEFKSISLFDNVFSNQDKKDFLNSKMKIRRQIVQNVLNDYLKRKKLVIAGSLQFIDLIGVELNIERWMLINDILSNEMWRINRIVLDNVNNNTQRNQDGICTIQIEKEYQIEDSLNRIRDRNYNEFLHLCNQQDFSNHISWLTIASLATNGFLFIPTSWEKDIIDWAFINLPKYLWNEAINRNRTMSTDGWKMALTQIGRENNIGIISLAMAVLSNGYGMLEEGRGRRYSILKIIQDQEIVSIIKGGIEIIDFNTHEIYNQQNNLNLLNDHFLNSNGELEYRNQRINLMRESINVWVSFMIVIEGDVLESLQLMEIFPDIVYIYRCLALQQILHTHIIIATKNPRTINHIIQKISNALQINLNQVNVSPIWQSINAAKQYLKNQAMGEPEETDFTDGRLTTQYSTCNYMYSTSNERFENNGDVISHNFPFGLIDAVGGGFPLFLIDLTYVRPQKLVDLRNSYMNFCETVINNLRNCYNIYGTLAVGKFPNTVWINDEEQSSDSVISEIQRWANENSRSEYYVFDVRGRLAPFISQPPPMYFMHNAVLLITTKAAWNDFLTQSDHEETTIETSILRKFYDMVDKREGWTVNIDLIGVIRK